MNDKRNSKGQFLKGNNGKLGFKHSVVSRKKMSISAWEGGKTKRYGYVLIYRPKHPAAICKYVREHRIIMEKHLGRYLKSEERVHHINGIKSDNRIKNLLLLPNESAHRKLHNEIRKIKCE